MDKHIKVQACIPMSSDVDELDNRLLTVTILDQEILEAVKLTSTQSTLTRWHI